MGSIVTVCKNCEIHEHENCLAMTITDDDRDLLCCCDDCNKTLNILLDLYLVVGCGKACYGMTLVELSDLFEERYAVLPEDQALKFQNMIKQYHLETGNPKTFDEFMRAYPRKPQVVS